MKQAAEECLVGIDECTFACDTFGNDCASDRMIPEFCSIKSRVVKFPVEQIHNRHARNDSFGFTESDPHNCIMDRIDSSVKACKKDRVGDFQYLRADCGICIDNLCKLFCSGCVAV